MAVDGTKGQKVARHDYRHHCNRLLFRAYLAPGTNIQIRCPKCGQMAVIQSPLDESEPVSIMVRSKGEDKG